MTIGAFTNTSSVTWCYYALANLLTHRKNLKHWHSVSTDLGSFLYTLYVSSSCEHQENMVEWSRAPLIYKMHSGYFTVIILCY